jgi:hypothetical protein
LFFYVTSLFTFVFIVVGCLLQAFAFAWFFQLISCIIIDLLSTCILCFFLFWTSPKVCTLTYIIMGLLCIIAYNSFLLFVEASTFRFVVVIFKILLKFLFIYLFILLSFCLHLFLVGVFFFSLL